ncbi:unnamed protein product [Trifolium pratense]|uniref:Uncharacterized protein n=1 Tax=Trifolium pratense TaxID=57577 RepID=A0ACB0IJ28_TRIPR|nr:unnamed protein product [Trifolium pratense]
MMEDEKTNKHGKKKKNTSIGSITIGGEGGITGLIVFGGALALAGFMAVTSFGRKKHKRKAIHPHHQQILLDEDKDSLVPYSTTQFGEDVTSCLASNECTKAVSSSELQPLIMEEKIDNEPNNACFHPQEIAFSDHSHPESTSSNENGVAEECQDTCDHEQKEEQKDESQDSLTTTETEDDDDDVDDDVMETDEEDSSITTGTTSLDEKEELIEQEYKKYYCESNLCNEEEMTVQKEALLNKTANLSVVQNDQPSILRTWVMPILMLGLLMIIALLTRGLQESLYVLDDGIL